MTGKPLVWQLLFGQISKSIVRLEVGGGTSKNILAHHFIRLFMILDKGFHTIGGHIKFSTFPNNPYFVVGGGAQSPHQNVLSTTPTPRYAKARFTTRSRFKVVVRFKGCLWRWVMAGGGTV